MPDHELRRGDRIGRFEVISDGPVAVKGWPDCTSPRCTRRNFTVDPDTGIVDVGDCVGWHCPRCGEPTSMLGHECAGEGEQS